MPALTPTKAFLNDLDNFRLRGDIYKKTINALALLENNPFHPGLHLERIVNDPTAWSIRVDKRYRISIDPEKRNSAGSPQWEEGITLLRVLDHDDLYKHPR